MSSSSEPTAAVDAGKPRFFAYPSIESYRDAVKDVQCRARYAGKDEIGKPIYDESKPVPRLTLKGTVKLHGANVGIGIARRRGGDPATNVCSELWCQSRNLVLTAEKRDTFGFYNFVEANNKICQELCARVLDARVLDEQATMETEKDDDNSYVYIFGEWAGKGVQKGVAISELEKSFFIFAACTVSFPTPTATEPSSVAWHNEALVSTLKAPDQQIYNIYDYPTWTLEIDFAQPQASQADLERITDEVEKCCPVAAHFGHRGVGEGVVWSAFTATTTSGSRRVCAFKVKGDQHRVVNSKKSGGGGAASVDAVKLANVQAFVEYAVTPNRLEQGISQLFTAVGKRAEPSDTSQFVQWVIDDVFKEESPRMTENGLAPNDVKKAIGAAAREFFVRQHCKAVQ